MNTTTINNYIDLQEITVTEMECIFHELLYSVYTICVVETCKPMFQLQYSAMFDIIREVILSD